MNQKKRIRKQIHILQRMAAVCLIVLLTLFPCFSVQRGIGQAQAAELNIDLLVKKSMLSDVTFDFFQEPIGSGIFYWIKRGGGPLFCIQQHERQLLGGAASERDEAFADGTHFTRSQYELVSIVLQCCSQRQEENGTLEAGEYLAGQAAIWGILSEHWMGTAQLRTEMERLHEHVSAWNGITEEELVEQSKSMLDDICQAIEDYYEDSSRYVPAFASKYPDRAPTWQAQWQEDGSCRAVFELRERAEAVKEFEFQMPKGWSYVWEGDQIIFTCRQPEGGMISVTGTAPEESVLGKAMPIGLIRLVIPDLSSYQHMVSGVEITVPWSCYFKLFVPEPPEGTGSWYLPEVFYYRHQEDFAAVYGAQLMKTDGDTKEPLAGVTFQALELFDAGQLEDTVLDPSQFAIWDGWKARCSDDTTNEEGRLRHWDRKEYHYEKTYCGGHPEPVIEYEGYSETKRQQLKEEAWEAWEASVEACRSLCDYHTEDGIGMLLLEADRDMAYEQFIHLVYGYTFQETKEPEGYLPHGESPKDTKIERIFCTSVQAGGAVFLEEDKPQQSAKSVDRVRAKASLSDAARKEQDISGSFGNGGGQTASNSNAEASGQKEEAGNANEAEEAERTASLSDASSNVQAPKWPWQEKLVWLTSLIEPAAAEEVDLNAASCYQFEVENHKPEAPPEETVPEETSPKATPSVPSAPDETGGKDRRDPKPPVQIPIEDPPKLLPPQEPALRVGWIQARYTAEPVQDSEKRGKLRGEENDIRKSDGKNFFPKTGDTGTGMDTLFVVMLLAGGGAVWAIWKRASEKGESGRLKGMWFALGIIWLMMASLGAIEVRAEETEAQQEIIITMPIVPQNQEDASTVPGDGAVPPEDTYFDENGQEYALDFYRRTEHILPEVEETVSITRFYQGLEGISQIPQQLSFEEKDEESGRIGTGQLMRSDVQQTVQYWSDDFSVPLTFYDYGADQYVFQDTTVPGGMELQYILEHSDLLLQQIGCSGEQYEILEINWDGEAYVEQGLLCRNARADGRKLAADYQVAYSGIIRYPEAVVPEWEAVYRLVPEQKETEEAEEDTAGYMSESAERESQPVSVPEPPVSDAWQNRWKVIRTLAACTVSLAVLIPLAVYLTVWFRKKEKDSRKKERM